MEPSGSPAPVRAQRILLAPSDTAPALALPLGPAAAAADLDSGSELDRAWQSMNERLRSTWRAMSPR